MSFFDSVFKHLENAANLVVLLFTIGEYFQNKALDKSTAQIASLNKLKVDYATLLNGEKVLVKDVNRFTKVVTLAKRDDIDLEVEEHLIVELYSK